MTKALEEQIGRTCSVGYQDTAISTAVRLILLQELENRSKEVKEQKKHGFVDIWLQSWHCRTTGKC